MPDYDACAVAEAIATRMWTGHDRSVIDEIFTDDVDYRDIAFKSVFTGKAGVRAYVDRVVGGMPDFWEKLDAVHDIGPGIIATRWRYGGTWKCERGTKIVDLPGVSVIHLRDGKVCLNHDFYGGQDFLDAIGYSEHDVDSFNKLFELT